MGPLLFLIYVNDLPQALNNQPRLYADDTCLIMSESYDQPAGTKLCFRIKNAKRWMDVNKLSRNIHKSTAMLIHPKCKIYSNNTSSSFKFDSLPQVDQVKYLGIEIDSQQNFKKYVNSIQNKTSEGVGILFKLSKIVSLNTLLMLYNSLIGLLPHLTYGITVWSSTFTSHL